MDTQLAPAAPTAPAKKPPPTCAHAYLWLRPTRPKGVKLPGFLRRFGLQQPDSRRNPFLWATRWVYGKDLLQQTLELAGRASSILVLGDSLPWLTWEIARANPKAKILALHVDPKAVDWTRQQFQERWPSQLDIVEVSQDFKLLLEPSASHKFDLVVWNFVPDATAIAEKGPDRAALMEAALSGLVANSHFVYYEATEPSALNLERWSRWRHLWARLSGQMSDPWNQRRAIENRYRSDGLRCVQKVSLEAGLFQTLQAALTIDQHRRNRPIIDTLLTSTQPGRFYFWLWLLLLWDRLALQTGLLEGSCRFATFSKKES